VEHSVGGTPHCAAAARISISLAVAPELAQGIEKLRTE